MNKQIEEMANDYYEAMLKARGTLGSMNEGAPKWYAKELYGKGWRKTADVAREIFAEIERLLSANMSGEFRGDSIEWFDYYELHLAEDIAELKKKYESEGADDV